MRASGSSGNVTIEISHRSTCWIRRTPVARSRRALHGAKSDGQSIERTAPASARAPRAPSATLRISRPSRIEPALILLQRRPHAERLVGIVLKQHLDAGRTAPRQALRERPRRHHVAAAGPRD